MFCVGSRSLICTRTRCDTPSWAWPVWLFAPEEKFPVKGLTHARDPIWFWLPFKPATYGSEQPGQRCVPVAQPLVLQVPQTFSSNASKVCFPHDWPICSKRSLLNVPPLIRYRFCGTYGWSVLENANQSTGWSPMLQESVPIASPTCV